MAGAGYKLFNTGDVLTAAQVNTYLQEQVVMVFASAAARTTALSAVLSEGMVSYLKDTNSTEVYDGSAWVSIASSGDITSVTAGTGLSGGGTSGDVTLSLATPVSATNGGTAQTTYATGDILYASATNTLAKRTVGTTGQVLTVSGGVPTWATPSSGGGMTLISTTSLTGSTVTLNNFSGYTDLQLVIYEAYGSNQNTFSARFNSDSGSNYRRGQYADGANNTAYTSIVLGDGTSNTNNTINFSVLRIQNYASTSYRKTYQALGSYSYWSNTSTGYVIANHGNYMSTSAITSIDLFFNSGSFSGGTAVLWGIK
jgi:hypothetical protein